MFYIFFKTLNISNSPKSFWEPLNIILTLLIFSITIKSMYLIYLVLPFYLFIKIKNKYSFLKYFFTNKNFFCLFHLFFSFYLIFLLRVAFISSKIYMLSLSHRVGLPDSTLNYMSNHYESWAKSHKFTKFFIRRKTIFK